jgi:hypothetical protein
MIGAVELLLEADGFARHAACKVAQAARLAARSLTMR